MIDRMNSAQNREICACFNFFVDTYCKIKGEMLSYLRLNQYRRRAADCTNLRECLGDPEAAVDEGEEWRARKLFVVRTTILGGDRYKRQQMSDIIAISKINGHPVIFLTKRSNPKWEEIPKLYFPCRQVKIEQIYSTNVFNLNWKRIYT